MIWCLIVIIFLYNIYAELILGILGFIIVCTLISYLKPSKEWGKLLFYTRRTLIEKISVMIFIGLVAYTMVDAVQNGWNASVLYTGNPTGMVWVAWVKAIMMLVVFGLALLPDRVFENGFRDSFRFESWDCVESMEYQENGRVKITLKKPTIRRTAYLSLKPGDELPVMCFEKRVE